MVMVHILSNGLYSPKKFVARNIAHYNISRFESGLSYFVNIPSLPFDRSNASQIHLGNHGFSVDLVFFCFAICLLGSYERRLRVGTPEFRFAPSWEYINGFKKRD